MKKTILTTLLMIFLSGCGSANYNRLHQANAVEPLAIAILTIAIPVIDVVVKACKGKCLPKSDKVSKSDNIDGKWRSVHYTDDGYRISWSGNGERIYVICPLPRRTSTCRKIPYSGIEAIVWTCHNSKKGKERRVYRHPYGTKVDEKECAGKEKIDAGWDATWIDVDRPVNKKCRNIKDGAIVDNFYCGHRSFHITTPWATRYKS